MSFLPWECRCRHGNGVGVDNPSTELGACEIIYMPRRAEDKLQSWEMPEWRRERGMEQLLPAPAGTALGTEVPPVLPPTAFPCSLNQPKSSDYSAQKELTKRFRLHESLHPSGLSRADAAEALQLMNSLRHFNNAGF